MEDSSRPAVSIVVPVYNGGDYLRPCLESIVAQTWTDREILVMDDASTDATAEVAKEFAGRVVYFRQPANRGQFRNVEDGIARAAGRYVAVFHADDVYDPDIVEREVAYLDSHPEVGLVFALVRFADAGGRVYGELRLPPSIRGRGPLDHAAVLNGVLEFKNVFMPTPAGMARRALYPLAGPYRTEFGSAADLDMWLRFAKLARIGLIERPMMNYRHTLTSAGQSYQRLRTVPENYFAIVDGHLAAEAPPDISPAAMRAYEAHRAVDQIRIAVNAYIQADRSTAAEALRASHLAHLLASSRVGRLRHLALWALLAVACRLPHMSWLGSALFWRFYRRLPWWRVAERSAP